MNVLNLDDDSANNDIIMPTIRNHFQDAFEQYLASYLKVTSVQAIASILDPRYRGYIGVLREEVDIDGEAINIWDHLKNALQARAPQSQGTKLTTAATPPGALQPSTPTFAAKLTEAYPSGGSICSSKFQLRSECNQ